MKRGLTLIELLITMAIMAVIAAAVMGTASAAMESARRSRTRTLITKIDGLLSEILASYETRRVSPHPDFEIAIRHSFAREIQGQAIADARLLAMRETIKYEVPDKFADVLAEPVILNSRPTISLQYAAKWNGMANKNYRFQNAELLYLVIMHRAADGEARTLFSAQDIGDVDGDGANEFLDGWGNPINYIRWPSHYGRDTLPTQLTGNMQPDPIDMYRRDAPQTAPGPNYDSISFPPGHPAYKDVKTIMKAEAVLLRDQYPAFMLRPLIYSTGPDGVDEINSLSDEQTQGIRPFDPDKAVGAVRDFNNDGENGTLDDITNYRQDY